MCSLPVTGDTADLWVSTLHPLALLNSRIRFRGCLLLFACFCSCLGIFCVDCRYILSEFLKGNRAESFQNKSFWELPWLLLFSGSVASDSLRPHGLQHARPPCPRVLESAQTHVHWVSDAIWPSHPLSSPSPPALSLYQHQGLFKWLGYLYQVAKVLELHNQSPKWIFRVDIL